MTTEILACPLPFCFFLFPQNSSPHQALTLGLTLSLGAFGGLAGTYVSVPLGYHLSTGENPCRVLPAPQFAGPGNWVKLRVFTWEVNLEDWGEIWFSGVLLVFGTPEILFDIFLQRLSTKARWQQSTTTKACFDDNEGTFDNGDNQ